MGNCDTHVFLGSNSYKTVEYFSKALGEKTIERDSLSISKDKQNHRTGKSISDQVMARALMTPDELRRMDNDDCIIFEKGIKPVKAKKFYYFKHSMAKDLARLEISHNDIGEIDRGSWRKYNPYNPYVENKDEKAVENLNIESLDDLFDDIDSPKEEKNSDKISPEEVKQNLLMEDINDKADNTSEIPPILPQDDEEDTYDLQKELEAKFDELFGPFDDDNN